jgi:heme oxygenase
LNRLIIARLPLALPPITSTPLLYTIGLTAFASVYTTFEHAWDTALSSASSTQTLPPELRDALALLLDLRIRRTEALKRDLAALRRHTQDELEPLDTLSHNLKTTFPADIRAAIVSRPHVVVAYAWVMYMALFSGGRWIRMILQEAGPEFWGHPHPHTEEQQEGAGYSFLMFDGSQDGEDVKAEFKAQLARVQEVMSEQQREDVVQEARYIFRACIELVEELDTRLATPMETKVESESMATKEVNASVTKEVMDIAVPESEQKETQSGMTTTAAPLLLALALVLLYITFSEPLKRLITYTGYTSDDLKR